MSSYPPYVITHIHLDKEPQLPALTYQGQGNYVVFWWKNVALGHSFIEPNQVVSSAQWPNVILKAIEPAVARYAAKAGVDTAQWQVWVTQEEVSRWSEWLGTLLKPWAPDTIQPQVPVSVIICTRNRAASLQLCIEALNRMTCQPAEIIVVDNAPPDDSTKKVAESFANVRYVMEPSVGLSYARNAGVRNSTSDIVAFTDDDVLVHPEWVYRVWETFLDKSVFAMTGLIIAAELDTEAQQIFEKHWSFNRGYQDIAYDQAYFKRVESAGPPVWEIGAGANTAFRKEVFNRVGLFDERLGPGAAGCNDDSEMWFRVLVGGCTIQYNPRAVVYHTHRREVKDLKRQIFTYMSGFTTAALIQQKHHPRAGYAKQLYWHIPKYYGSLLRAGFPRFTFRNRTLWAELKGIVNGLKYYYEHRNQPSQSHNQ
ncbi:glycosyltransferase [Hymenobacter taeanensis]|uniref:Glycosyltransferase n=1 Tax=Hymenobacter taeanensis TaxID=2735321 RepID=A0A6M6BM56_9BACT|nr:MULTISPECIES: glycosyltransferase [Hymenobacter]QJX49057.1 glycosyltransferase [Hymenobacter taeanensis]UOQ81422.1 glycosyltransferase [Hymenobacter sp. 5414T-23]